MPSSLADIGGHITHASHTSAKKYGVQPKSANHSRLMDARMKTGIGGEVPNFCPFGCSDEHLDENGYCLHLIGFTVGDKVQNGEHVPGKLFERLGPPDTDGRRRMQIKRVMVKGKLRPVYEQLDPAKHTCERITSNHRVYENVPLEQPVLEDEDEDDETTDELTDDTADDSE